MVVNALSPTLLNLVFAKLEFPQSIQRCFMKKGCGDYNQKEANQLYEHPHIHFP